jgi:nitroimidazol reductase NimA-like FMN-containing flavoprotein (pyridoxamine 5'-phosphate oxidase superfamily)
MFKEMRRKDRALHKTEIERIIGKAEFGVMSSMDINGYPYGVPMSFVMTDEKIYFHCAANMGHKVENIRNNPKVCFTVIGYTEPLPDKFATVYESVIAFGTAKEVTGETKKFALKMFIEKYSSGYEESGLRYIEIMIDRTSVFEISIDHITGKARKKESKHNLDFYGKTI